MYRYALLDPRPLPAAEARNAASLGPLTLGIEVTVPRLAARCGLGNADPQHADGDASRAAIEVCLDWPPPPVGATLATVRADLDSVGGMVVLARRAAGEVLDDGVQGRIARVAAADRFARGPWPGPRPLLASLGAFLDEDAGSLAPVALAVADHVVPFDRRVRAMAAWLAVGVEPPGYAHRWRTRQAALLASLADGTTRLESAAGGRIAVVDSRHDGALRLAYRAAPVVVALNAAHRLQGGPPHRKATIAQYAAGHIDLLATVAVLAAREPGWGGSPTIAGSPQGAGTRLSRADIVAAVEAHLLPSVEQRFGPARDDPRER